MVTGTPGPPSSPSYACKCRHPSEVEFLGTISKYSKRNKILSLLVYVVHKTEIRHVYVVVVQKRAQKCTKKRGARAKLLFC